MNAFLEIARNLYNDYLHCVQCPDQIVGKIIKQNNGNFNFDLKEDDFKIRNNIDYKDITSGRKLILVLESPHIQEYIKPYGPAKGTTGKNIRELFIEVCGPDISIGSFDLILMNAIQYQCSLGFPTKYFRDKMFLEAWNTFAKNDFIERLTKLIRKEDIIINVCTAGRNKIKIRDLVENEINEILQSLEVLKLAYEHPSNWARRKNTAIKNKIEPNYKQKTKS